MQTCEAAARAAAFASGGSPWLQDSGLADRRDSACGSRRDRRHSSAGSASAATYLALRDLDARTLHDIGLHRSEILSVAAEVAGAFEATRVHAMHVERSYDRRLRSNLFKGESP